ncbi:hypothetical protein FVE85_3459 [Porphyridium purpureum]|uniref:Uncharacterized protein n=1 Tax=Porphyridium purpureum TaxID=35688 RepID=A0A5J4YG37_PORPP|nr:hypothetical protein FVE85_3459 [Porphyridium purpureum]|eukprot:POR3339..scf228_30
MPKTKYTHKHSKEKRPQRYRKYAQHTRDVHEAGRSRRGDVHSALPAPSSTSRSGEAALALVTEPQRVACVHCGIRGSHDGPYESIVAERHESGLCPHEATLSDDGSAPAPLSGARSALLRDADTFQQRTGHGPSCMTGPVARIGSTNERRTMDADNTFAARSDDTMEIFEYPQENSRPNSDEEDYLPELPESEDEFQAPEEAMSDDIRLFNAIANQRTTEFERALASVPDATTYAERHVLRRQSADNFCREIELAWTESIPDSARQGNFAANMTAADTEQICGNADLSFLELELTKFRIEIEQCLRQSSGFISRHVHNTLFKTMQQILAVVLHYRGVGRTTSQIEVHAQGGRATIPAANTDRARIGRESAENITEACRALFSANISTALHRQKIFIPGIAIQQTRIPFGRNLKRYRPEGFTTEIAYRDATSLVIRDVKHIMQMYGADAFQITRLNCELGANQPPAWVSAQEAYDQRGTERTARGARHRLARAHVEETIRKMQEFKDRPVEDFLHDFAGTDSAVAGQMQGPGMQTAGANESVASSPFEGSAPAESESFRHAQDAWYLRHVYSRVLEHSYFRDERNPPPLIIPVAIYADGAHMHKNALHELTPISISIIHRMKFEHNGDHRLPMTVACMPDGTLNEWQTLDSIRMQSSTQARATGRDMPQNVMKEFRKSMYHGIFAFLFGDWLRGAWHAGMPFFFELSAHGKRWTCIPTIYNLGMDMPMVARLSFTRLSRPKDQKMPCQQCEAAGGGQREQRQEARPVENQSSQQLQELERAHDRRDRPDLAGQTICRKRPRNSDQDYWTLYNGLNGLRSGFRFEAETIHAIEVNDIAALDEMSVDRPGSPLFKGLDAFHPWGIFLFTCADAMHAFKKLLFRDSVTVGLEMLLLCHKAKQVGPACEQEEEHDWSDDSLIHASSAQTSRVRAVSVRQAENTARNRSEKVTHSMLDSAAGRWIKIEAVRMQQDLTTRGHNQFQIPMRAVPVTDEVGKIVENKYSLSILLRVLVILASGHTRCSMDGRVLSGWIGVCVASLGAYRYLYLKCPGKMDMYNAEFFLSRVSKCMNSIRQEGPQFARAVGDRPKYHAILHLATMVQLLGRQRLFDVCGGESLMKYLRRIFDRLPARNLNVRRDLAHKTILQTCETDEAFSYAISLLERRKEKTGNGLRGECTGEPSSSAQQANNTGCTPSVREHYVFFLTGDIRTVLDKTQRRTNAASNTLTSHLSLDVEGVFSYVTSNFDTRPDGCFIQSLSRGTICTRDRVAFASYILDALQHASPRVHLGVRDFLERSRRAPIMLTQAFVLRKFKEGCRTQVMDQIAPLLDADANNQAAGYEEDVSAGRTEALHDIFVCSPTYMGRPRYDFIQYVSENGSNDTPRFGELVLLTNLSGTRGVAFICPLETESFCRERNAGAVCPCQQIAQVFMHSKRRTRAHEINREHTLHDACNDYGIDSQKRRFLICISVESIIQKVTAFMDVSQSHTCLPLEQKYYIVSPNLCEGVETYA